MIRSVRANDRRFKEVQFEPGFNVVLADTTEESSEKESRNGLGKSTLINIIHYCLGSRLDSVKDLIVNELDDWEFFLDLTVQDLNLTVKRGFKPHTKVTIFGDWKKLSMPEKAAKHEDCVVLSIADWNLILGNLMFGLPTEEKVTQKYKPSFRSLISYFIRRGPAAYFDPFKHFSQQPEHDIQIENCFLLGLNWEDAANWQTLKDKKKELDKLKKQAAAGLLPGMDARLSELEAKKIQLDEVISKEREQLEEFEVNPQYREIEKEAAGLTQKIHELNEANLQDERLILFYEESLEDETPADIEMLLRTYEEAKVELPELVVKRFKDVEFFHSKVIENRKSFLQSEIERLRNQCDEREGQERLLTNKRKSLMKVLQTQGALDEFLHLQNRHNDKVVKARSIDKQIESVTLLEKGRSMLQIEKEQLYQMAQTDYLERRTAREQAIKVFNRNSQYLYDHSGELLIDVEKTGFKFDIRIPRGKSEGFQQMKVFCYDLMLAELWSGKNMNPGLLVHDSTIFGDVDERQKALALQLAKEKSDTLGFQYICMLNSDSVPWDDLATFDLEEFVRLTLTDDDETGGLLGLRIDETKESNDEDLREGL